MVAASGSNELLAAAVAVTLVKGPDHQQVMRFQLPREGHLILSSDGGSIRDGRTANAALVDATGRHQYLDRMSPKRLEPLSSPVVNKQHGLISIAPLS